MDFKLGRFFKLGFLSLANCIQSTNINSHRITHAFILIYSVVTVLK